MGAEMDDEIDEIRDWVLSFLGIRDRQGAIQRVHTNVMNSPFRTHTTCSRLRTFFAMIMLSKLIRHSTS
jgi:hypothetical protein